MTTLELDEYTEGNVISPMGIFGVLTHPEVCEHVEACIAQFDMNEDFTSQDVLAYLYEIYGGPYNGPMLYVTPSNLENALETHLCVSWVGEKDYDRPVGVEYSYDWNDYETFYWRCR